MTEIKNLSPLEMKKQELRRRIEAPNEKKVNHNANLLEEKQTQVVKENTLQKTQIIVDKIILDISVELTPEERNNWVQLCHRGFNIPVDNSIYLLFNLLISDENDFQVKFSQDAKIDCMYHQLEPSENQNNPLYNRWKVEVRIHQDDRIKKEILPSKTKVFELLLGDYEVNYYLNNFYNYVKWQKEILEKEAKFCEDSIIKEIQKSKKLLEMSHKLNTVKLTKILDNFNSKKSVGVESKKIDIKEEKEMKKRWKERFEKWTHHLTQWPDWNYIKSLNYKDNGLEIQLLADILKMDIWLVRRIVKRLEKKTNKKYIFSNKKWTKIIDNTWWKITKKSIGDIYSKSIGFITFEWFFDILAYVRSL